MEELGVARLKGLICGVSSEFANQNCAGLCWILCVYLYSMQCIEPKVTQTYNFAECACCKQHLHGQSEVCEVVFRDPFGHHSPRHVSPTNDSTFCPHMLLIRMCEGNFFPLLTVERGFNQMESPVFMQSNYFVLS